MIRFVIVTPGRSGSTFLAKSLNQHAEVNCEQEIFNRSVHTPGSFNAFIASRIIYRFIGFFFNRERLSTSLLNLPLKWLIKQFLHLCSDANKIYGFKISLDQLFAYPQLLKFLAEYKIIYLTREDKQRMVLSLLTARQTGNYESFSGEKVTLNPALVKDQLYELLGWEKLCLEKFPNVLYLTSENLFSNSEATFEKIQNHLGLSNQIMPIKSTKTHPDSISEWIENYAEIENYLQSDA